MKRSGIVAIPLPIGPELEANAGQGEEKGEENKGFLGIFLGAGCSLRKAPAVVMPVIVLGGKDKRRQPEVGEHSVNCNDKETEATGNPNRCEAWQEEYNRHRGNNLGVFRMFTAEMAMDEVRCDTHYNNCAGPLQDPVNK